MAGAFYRPVAPVVLTSFAIFTQANLVDELEAPLKKMKGQGAKELLKELKTNPEYAKEMAHTMKSGGYDSAKDFWNSAENSVADDSDSSGDHSNARSPHNDQVSQSNLREEMDARQPGSRRRFAWNPEGVRYITTTEDWRLNGGGSSSRRRFSQMSYHPRPSTTSYWDPSGSASTSKGGVVAMLNRVNPRNRAILTGVVAGAGAAAVAGGIAIAVKQTQRDKDSPPPPPPAAPKNGIAGMLGGADGKNPFSKFFPKPKPLPKLKMKSLPTMPPMKYNMGSSSEASSDGFASGQPAPMNGAVAPSTADSSSSSGDAKASASSPSTPVPATTSPWATIAPVTTAAPTTSTIASTTVLAAKEPTLGDEVPLAVWITLAVLVFCCIAALIAALISAVLRSQKVRRKRAAEKAEVQDAAVAMRRVDTATSYDDSYAPGYAAVATSPEMANAQIAAQPFAMITPVSTTPVATEYVYPSAAVAPANVTLPAPALSFQGSSVAHVGGSLGVVGNAGGSVVAVGNVGGSLAAVQNAGLLGGSFAGQPLLVHGNSVASFSNAAPYGGVVVQGGNVYM